MELFVQKEVRANESIELLLFGLSKSELNIYLKVLDGKKTPLK
jgi:hypothetical protein